MISDKKRKYEIAMILIIAGLYFFSFFQRVAIPGTIFNELQAHYSISAAAVTKLSAIYLLVYALMQPFAGYLADRFGGIKVILISGALLCAGSLCFPFSGSTMELYMSRALVGLGASTMYLCMVKETDHYFSSKNFAPVFGLLCLLGYSGGMAGTRPFRTLVEFSGWQNACLIIAAATFIVLIPGFFLMKKVDRDRIIKKDSHIIQSIVSILKNHNNYPLLLTTPVCFSLYFTIQAIIGPKFLQDFCGVSSMTASNYTLAMMLAVMTAMMSSGVLSKLLGNKRKFFVLFNSVSTILAMILLLLGTLYKMPSLFFLPAYLLPAFASGCTPVNVSLMKELNDPGKPAVSIGIMNTTTYAMVAVMSQVAGKTLDIFNSQTTLIKGVVVYPDSAYITLFSVLLAVSVIPVAASFFCRETNGENIYAI